MRMDKSPFPLKRFFPGGPLLLVAAGVLSVLMLVPFEGLFSSSRNPQSTSEPAKREGPYFFFDDRVIAAKEGVELKVCPPTKHGGNPIVPSKNPYLELDLASGPAAVLPAENGSAYRMWYVPYGRGKAGVHFGYATSTDGVHWDFPDLGLIDFQGNKHNNLLLTHGIVGRVIIDKNPVRPEERYKAVVYRHEPAPAGFSVSFSPDGLRWSPPELIEELLDVGDIQGQGASDVLIVFFDGARREFVAVFKMWSLEGQFSVPVKRGIDAPRCARRVVGISRSRDFRHWAKARQIILPDDQDPQTLEFYGLQSVVKRGDLYIGFLPCLIDDAPPDGIGWTELVISHDGDNWRRIRERFIDREADKPEAPDRAIAWAWEILSKGDEEFVYYSASRDGHKSGPRSIGLAVMKKNRFASLSAANTEGLILTKPLILPAGKEAVLKLNASAKGGEVRVELRDAGGTLAGYSFEDCDPITSDGLSIPVRWKGKTRLPQKSAPVQFAFKVKNASLFTFGF